MIIIKLTRHPFYMKWTCPKSYGRRVLGINGLMAFCLLSSHQVPSIKRYTLKANNLPHLGRKIFHFWQEPLSEETKLRGYPEKASITRYQTKKKRGTMTRHNDTSSKPTTTEDCDRGTAVIRSTDTTKTCLFNVDLLKPHFHIVKLGLTWVYIIFLISALNIDCE